MYYGYYVPADNNTITGLTSNILPQDSVYYWADREQISCVDTALNVVWQKEFPDVKASRSMLFMQDGKLFMLNYGYGLREGRSRKKYGRPFIACYDPQNGEELFFNQLSVKKDMIENALHTDNALYMLFDDGMAYQELADSVVNIVPWDTKRHGKLEEILPSTLYVATTIRPFSNRLPSTASIAWSTTNRASSTKWTKTCTSATPTNAAAFTSPASA